MINDMIYLLDKPMNHLFNALNFKNIKHNKEQTIMQTNENSNFFSLDLAIGNWRWWFGIVATTVSMLSMMLLNAKHHVVLVLIFITTLLLSLLIKPRRINRQDYGLVLPKPLKTIIWTLLAVAVFAGLVYWFEHSSVEAREASKQVMESLNFGENYARDLLLILTVCVFAPLNEELIYRGVVFRGVWNSLLKQQRFNFGSNRTKKWLSFAIATGISSFMFMGIHGGGGQDTQIYMILLLGIIACSLYALTGSILAPIMFHGLNNTLALSQSLQAKHMVFTTQADTMSLTMVMYMTPVLTMVIVLGLWLLVTIFSKVKLKGV